jgi:hypothetical protein
LIEEAPMQIPRDFCTMAAFQRAKKLRSGREGISCACPSDLFRRNGISRQEKSVKYFLSGLRAIAGRENCAVVRLAESASGTGIGSLIFF